MKDGSKSNVARTLKTVVDASQNRGLWKEADLDGAWCWWPGHLYNPETTSWGLNYVIPDWFGVRVRQITIAYGIKAILSTDKDVSLLVLENLVQVLPEHISW